MRKSIGKIFRKKKKAESTESAQVAGSKSEIFSVKDAAAGHRDPDRKSLDASLSALDVSAGRTRSSLEDSLKAREIQQTTNSFIAKPETNVNTNGIQKQTTSIMPRSVSPDNLKCDNMEKESDSAEIAEEPNTRDHKEEFPPSDPTSTMNLKGASPVNVPPTRQDTEDSLGIFPETISPVVHSYDQIAVLEQTKLPRGGVSVETKAVGRVQFGIPPETIKDSMRLGIPVPQVYIVPIERFCREMGPALGVNLAEFEFPAYFNFFVYKKRCTLVVDSEDAEDNIRRVFSETLLGPAQFLRPENPISHEPEDFDPEFPPDMIPDFQKEFQHFRIMPDGKELVIETLLDFCHFENRPDGHSNLGVPPSAIGADDESDSDASAEVEALQLDVEASEKEECVPTDAKDLENSEKKKTWTYSQTRFMGEVAVVWPPSATDEEKMNRSVPRVEIFKMPGGTEYIIHDVDANNVITGKARFSGHVKVSENLRVDGFGGASLMDELRPKNKIRPSTDKGTELEDESWHHDVDLVTTIPMDVPPPTFHPPSFGVTILGNSHGFDASGSTSGYVLWINGRGVMIDPPPYSSATLEREGIRPRTIVGIILTHCHADHDAGAFQKVLTGSPVVVITTPTIYKSFIRKYAALSALSPALLRHSHRYKAAIIGQPLRFQGATFKFTYSLHTIPCVGFRVEWRGRSMVFTADHFNNPAEIEKLREKGILSRGRADDLQNIPLQDCDLLLHEAGAPPIHTPLEVLMQLPAHIKKRLYVVHTAKLPEGCDLKAAPTGCAGTIRLDSQMYGGGSKPGATRSHNNSFIMEEAGFVLNGQEEYETISEEVTIPQKKEVGKQKVKNRGRTGVASSVFAGTGLGNDGPPLVALRLSSSTDAWFILNLLSAVPFISSLSYTSTMELLETARVDAYRQNDVIIHGSRRSHVLCVVWEGTCSEKLTIGAVKSDTMDPPLSVWYAGDWTGPLSLQPDRVLSGESPTSANHDVVAISCEGVKVITVEFSSLHTILNHGSPLYRKYLERTVSRKETINEISGREGRLSESKPFADKAKELNVLELLNCNSALRKLNAVQKRHVESLAEGPVSFQPNERMWQAGTPVDRAFIIVSGTASFQVRRNAGASMGLSTHDTSDRDGSLASDNCADSVRVDALKVIRELDKYAQSTNHHGADDYSDMSSVELDDNRQFPVDLFGGANAPPGSNHASFVETKDFDFVAKGLQARATYLGKEDSVSSNASVEDESHDNDHDSRLAPIFSDDDPGTRSRRTSVIKRRGSRARFANKVLGRLYNRRAFTSGLVFSRGHFLGDVSKMVAGLLSAEENSVSLADSGVDEDGPSYGFGERADADDDNKRMMGKISEMTIHEQEGSHLILHSSTLTAGKDGCVAFVFPKSSLIPLLDEYPGFLLSLLGTQVVV